MYIDKEVINGLFDKINENNIRYVITKNIDNELPGKLKNNKDIDLLIHPDDRIRFLKLIKTNGFKRLAHPYGRENGWNLLYNMDDFYFYYKEGLHLDISFQLCCRSLMPECWIPLDLEINNSVWDKRYKSKLEAWFKMDEINQLVYLITRCIFDKKRFSESYINEIEKLSIYYEENETINKLEKVFFKFTPTLINLLKEKNYTSIVGLYLSFANY